MLLKPDQARNKNSSYIVKLQSFQSEALALFDICSCKSANIYRCACPKDCKVSAEDKLFLADQRSCTCLSVEWALLKAIKRLEKLGMKPHIQYKNGQ